MELMGIKFAPLFLPIHRRLEILAATTALYTIIFGGVIGSLFMTYLIIYTNYWLVALLYLTWVFVIDRNSCERGGRRSEWVRGWTWWKYFKDYFPVRLQCASRVELDPKRNYLFCFYPHGLLPIGFFTAFSTNSGGFQELFPNHIPYPITITHNFRFPILRELVLALGGCNPSKNSLDWILGPPEGGKIAVLAVGGAAEAFNCNRGEYRIVLKNRKGFIKMALRHGTPLVPVFSFGETEIYNQLHNPEGSVLRNIQEWLKKKTGIAFALPMGRGFFQYSFGTIPHRRPIFTIVGKPVEVVKVEHPTQEQIDSLHEEFTKRLMELFEEQKYNYAPNPQETTLIVE